MRVKIIESTVVHTSPPLHRTIPTSLTPTDTNLIIPLTNWEVPATGMQLPDAPNAIRSAPPTLSNHTHARTGEHYQLLTQREDRLAS
ncbi:hypothetical protein BaRGS_00014446 [Batillaria attramentaria]|uniref:Uncharacterized protein n=1 Tax=Batillaria attramentaria TaxID=370345 RepID=A0ABD0L556_9CAEN